MSPFWQKVMDAVAKPGQAPQNAPFRPDHQGHVFPVVGDFREAERLLVELLQRISTRGIEVTVNNSVKLLIRVL